MDKPEAYPTEARNSAADGGGSLGRGKEETEEQDQRDSRYEHHVRWCGRGAERFTPRVGKFDILGLTAGLGI